MKKIVAVGRGGVGKSSFIALLAKYLRSVKKNSILLIDADPDENLADLLGLDLEKLEIKTISDVLFDVRFGNINERLKSFSLAEKIEFMVNQKALYEGEDFDFLSIGAKWTEGCYCQPNNILKGLIDGLQKNYEYILIDSPAGLEHINRRITSSVDDIFEILDPTKKAFQHLKRVYKIITEIKINFNNFFLLGNFRFKDAMIDAAASQSAFKYIGRLEYDKDVEEFNLQGRSLLTLKEDSPLFVAIKRIATSLGY